MQNFIKYLAPFMAICYILTGLWLLLAKYMLASIPQIPNGQILGALLLLYGCFRLYRFWKLNQNNADENEQ